MAFVVMPVSQLTPRLSNGSVCRGDGQRPARARRRVHERSRSWTASSGYLSFIGGLFVFGVGMAMSSTPATTAIVSSLPEAKQGVASAMNNTTREIGSAPGVRDPRFAVRTAGYGDSIAS